MVADEIYCHLRLYGTVADGDRFDVVPSPSTWVERGATVTSGVFAAAVRRPMVMPQSKYKWTNATATLSTVLGETNTLVQLHLRYVHAIEFNAEGKPTRAVQHTMVDGSALKVKPGGIISISPMTPLSGDPFDPASGFEAVKLGDDGIPVAHINKTQFLETTAGSGVLKVSCQNSPIITVPPPPVVER